MSQNIPRRIPRITIGVVASTLLVQVALADPQDDRIQKEIRDRESAWKKTQSDRDEAVKRERARNASDSQQNIGGFPGRPARTVDSPAAPYISPGSRYVIPYDRGIRYRNGDGVAKDPVEAMRCFLLVTDTRDSFNNLNHQWDHIIANANYQIGLMYDLGEGVARDSSLAAYWFAKAAELGNRDAAVQLGDIDFSAHINLGEAAKWYRKGAELGDTGAQLKLGRMYFKGQGIPQDNILASLWLEKAAAHGNTSAKDDLDQLNRELAQGNGAGQFAIGLKYYNGDGVAKDATEAIKWFRKAADQDNVDALYNLGLMYEAGQGVAKDDAQAAKWYRQAAESGNAVAQIRLGKKLRSGKGIAKDQTEAAKWLLEAAEQGVAEAQFMIGEMYYEGSGVAQDEAEAVKWCRKAAEQGVVKAQCMTGRLCKYENPAVAVKWYLKAAVQGNTQAQVELASMYEGGIGVTKQDLVEAWAWYNIAANSGDYLAKDFIANFEYNAFSVEQWSQAEQRTRELAAQIKAKQGH